MRGLYCSSAELLLSVSLLVVLSVLDFCLLTQAAKASAQSEVSVDSDNKDQTEKVVERRITDELITELIDPSALVVPEKIQQKTSIFGISKFISSLDRSRSYNRINSFLVDAESSDDLNLNMAKAFDYLQWEIKRNSFMGGPLLDALRQFTSLAKTQGLENCNKQSYAILLKNDRATEGRARDIRSKQQVASVSPRRIDKLIYQFSLNHSKNCQLVYPKIFHQIHSTLDNNKSKIVDSLLMQVFFGSNSNQANGAGDNHVMNIMSLYNGFVANTISIASIDDSQLIYGALEQIAREKEDPDVIYMKGISDERRGTRYVRKDKLKELFRRYFYEPCEYYVRQLGPDVFIPATFDSEWQHEVDYRQYDYYFGWAKFKLCTFLLDNEGAMILNLAKIAKWTK